MPQLSAPVKTTANTARSALKKSKATFTSSTKRLIRSS